MRLSNSRRLDKEEKTPFSPASSVECLKEVTPRGRVNGETVEGRQAQEERLSRPECWRRRGGEHPVGARGLTDRLMMGLIQGRRRGTLLPVMAGETRYLKRKRNK